MLKPGDYLAPTGRLIVGNTMDCNKAALERALKFYDSQLYLNWNPKKRGGWGMWEVRRRPDTMSKVYHGKINGVPLYTFEYKELDIIAHVIDLPVLSYDVIGKIKAMDTWANGELKNFSRNLEYSEAKHREKEEKKNRDELRYNIKQHKREWREFAQLVSQGVSPSQVLKGMRLK